MPVTSTLLASLALIAALGLTPGLARISAPPSTTVGAAEVVRADEDGPSVPASRLSPETLELGEMMVGRPTTVPFTVKNTSSQSITVESVKGGCGCTTVTAPPKAPIAPGESFTVEVTVDPGKRGGVDLVKPLYVAFVGGPVESVRIVGRVKAVATVTPSTIEATEAVDATRRLVVEAIDGARFRVTGITPVGILSSPTDAAPSSRAEFAFDFAAWDRAGRPASIIISTDLAGVAELVVPVRSTEAVLMFRLPAASGDGSARTTVEASQDEIIRRLDEALSGEQLSSQFRMRLHRESGMLFVHGTERDVESVRGAVRALPASMGVRESQPVQGA